LLQKDIPEWNKVRLVALYALRYERHQNNSLAALRELLVTCGVDPLKVAVCTNPLLHPNGEQTIDALMAYAGGSQRQEELFSSSDFFSRARSGFKGLKGVENVYTQHTPFLERTLSALTKARLPEKLFPFVDPGDGSVVSAVREKPQDIIVFMVGGTTYEEGKLIAGINETLPGVRIVLGGTSVINCSMFLKVLYLPFLF
jgi:vacuolar protein sorting-associated protein 45